MGLYLFCEADQNFVLLFKAAQSIILPQILTQM